MASAVNDSTINIVVVIIIIIIHSIYNIVTLCSALCELTLQYDIFSFQCKAFVVSTQIWTSNKHWKWIALLSWKMEL